MTAYALATLQNVKMGDDIVRYLERIDDTLAPYQGVFLVHGGKKQELEGHWPGDVVVIGFPDLSAAEAWYRSPEYAAIKPLRTNNSSADIILISGVGEGHKATDVLDLV